jgi:hypothetical protein
MSITPERPIMTCMERFIEGSVTANTRWPRIEMLRGLEITTQPDASMRRQCSGRPLQTIPISDYVNIQPVRNANEELD